MEDNGPPPNKAAGNSDVSRIVGSVEISVAVLHHDVAIFGSFYNSKAIIQKEVYSEVIVKNETYTK